MQGSNEGNKELLSEHVENIFKGYTKPGLHVCDIATGGGKSYTIGKLTCEFYPQHFNRIIILCVQTKLVKGMNDEIERFINKEGSQIKTSDKLVIENNTETITKAVNEGTFKQLLDEMNFQNGEFKNKGNNLRDLSQCYNRVKKIFEGLSGLIETKKAANNDYLDGEIEKSETALRNAVRVYFDTYKRLYEKWEKKRITPRQLYRNFPSLTTVYPQVEYNDKRVLLMTVHKAMYGIDPILSDKIYLSNFADKKKTLILFDESDQAAIAMRGAIIDQAIEIAGGNKRFAKGYVGYLQYKTLIDHPEQVSIEYHDKLLEECILKAKDKTQQSWENLMGKIELFKNIHLVDNEDLETYRRGVFFSGPTFKLNLSSKDDKTNSFICHKKGARHFCLVHSENVGELKKDYSTVVPVRDFLTLVVNNTTMIKSQLAKVVNESLKRSKENFDQTTSNIGNNQPTQNLYLGWPTLEREIHTLFSRFETTSEYQFEQQMNEFITNRKNRDFSDGESKQKFPDFSVYFQGVQLFQEELDERDNKHRVRLSYREIQNTPEKIFYDLVNAGETSVVLCSATASNNSVVSNCDIKYLTQVLGRKVHKVSAKDREVFDRLSYATYPQEHKVEVVPVEHFEIADTRPNHLQLPVKYRQMFCEEAQNDGSVDEWFKCTRKLLQNICKDSNNFAFQLYRILQFVEAYHYFIKHDDIHSMIYFQNRTGEKDAVQYNVISSLIDGSYKDMPSEIDGELPKDWENKHLRITREWDEVEGGILNELKYDKDAKLMLVSAYGSFKAGTNMQYEIPDGLNFVSGDNWETEHLKKDWDAIFLQSPTGYLTMNEDGHELTFEKGLYNAMLTLMMLQWQGWLSPGEVNRWLCQALSGTFYFSEKNSPGIAKDKAAWAQTIVEQAVGRLCRTRNKPQTTHILYDDSMSKFFFQENLQKSLTKEFRTFAEFVIKHKNDTAENISAEKHKLCNDANYAQKMLNRLRRIALKYTPHPDNIEGAESGYLVDTEEEIPYRVKMHQLMNQAYKQTIIKKPTLQNLDDLTDVDKKLTFISTCYGKWPRRNDKGYSFQFENNKICNTGQYYPISPETVRLTVLMKNDVIRSHFEKNGFATDWVEGDYILHPQILANDYAGEIGEESFKAIVLHYTNCTEDNFKHLEGKDYELADFVICDKYGNNRIAFDVKNMRSDGIYDNRYGDLPTAEKRKQKEERLGCNLITVNMLQRKEESINPQKEIAGVIDENGEILPTAIAQLRKLINN